MLQFTLRTARSSVPTTVRTFSTTPVALKALTVQEINAKAKSLGISPPPKAPLGAYAEFFRELYPTIRNNYIRDDGKVASNEVAKVAGAKWSALTEEERKKYNQAAKLATEKYKADYKRYYESLPESVVKQLGIDSPAVKGLKKGARNAANRKLRGEPAKPSGSFFIFLHHFRKSDELKQLMEKDGITGAQQAIYTAKKAGERWGLMSAEEKQKWVDESLQQRNVYAEWKEKHA